MIVFIKYMGACNVYLTYELNHSVFHPVLIISKVKNAS